MIPRHGRDGPLPDLFLWHLGVFPQDGGYYLRKGGDAADLRAKRAEHRNASAWHGQGAVAQGLHPGKPVAAGAFEKLLQGHVIGTKLRLGRLRDGQHEHRPGFDITFSAPKSVSLAALLPTEEHPHGDRAVKRAHDGAVRETLDWIEATLLETRGWDPATRRRPRVKAPSMVAALFRHIAKPQPRSAAPHSRGDRQRDPERGRAVEERGADAAAPQCAADRGVLPRPAGAAADKEGLFDRTGYGGPAAELRARGLRPGAAGSVLDAQTRDPGLCGREGLGPWRGGDAGGDARDAQAESGAGAGSAAAAMAGPRTGEGSRHGARGGALQAADRAAGRVRRRWRSSAAACGSWRNGNRSSPSTRSRRWLSAIRRAGIRSGRSGTPLPGWSATATWSRPGSRAPTGPSSPTAR